MSVRLYADTNIFIRVVERPSGAPDAAADLFARAIDAGAVNVVTSELTLLELMVGPYQAGKPDLAASYEALLTARTGLDVVPVSRVILIRAALIRAESAAKTPDAIHIATAVLSGCSTIVTADKRLRSAPLPVADLETIAAGFIP
ncbi:type II toxin-antitoxin system VapC family toxin [Segnochrobactrum spirostomi]|uniref:type II toxin-antitoxin system VapC family toxin n=1 Tax=Segnochrobactrum spirostomi TaxID=2608987 RepID=UPI0012969B12|nr:type II toxin-antitoxin system VapC family toxin [Segnochrobactrum spirostomi]